MRLFRTIVSVQTMLLVVSTLCAAEKPAYVKPPKAKLQVFELSVHPASQPRPALKYHLLPGYLELTPGNAVPIYAKAAILLGANVGDEKVKKIREWLETPLDSLSREEIRKTLREYHQQLRLVDMAARRQQCQWDPPVREEQANVLGTLLPEVQSLRIAGYLVALRARLAMAEQDYDDAVFSLQTGYAMARHVARQPYLVSSLVAASIEGIMTGQVRDLISQPGAPNMYWAITALPSPPVDVHPSVEFENALAYLMFPEMTPSRRTELSAEQWTVLAPQVLARFAELHEKLARGPSVIDGDQGDFVKEALKAAPEARKHLIAAGYPKEKVEAMAPGQAVLVAIFDIYETCRDDLMKWQGLPYHQAWAGLKEAKAAIYAASDEPILTSLARWLLASLDVACCSESWHERTLAALRCVEVIRLYADDHDGKMPPSLDSIPALPAPINPMTGEPFRYSLEGEIGVVYADGGPEFLEPQEYRVRVVK